MLCFFTSSLFFCRTFVFVICSQIDAGSLAACVLKAAAGRCEFAVSNDCSVDEINKYTMSWGPHPRTKIKK